PNGHCSKGMIRTRTAALRPVPKRPRAIKTQKRDGDSRRSQCALGVQRLAARIGTEGHKRHDHDDHRGRDPGENAAHARLAEPKRDDQAIRRCPRASLRAQSPYTAACLRDVPALASADDLPFVACNQRPDTLPTQISPKASAIFVVSLWRKSFRRFAIL